MRAWTRSALAAGAVGAMGLVACRGPLQNDSGASPRRPMALANGAPPEVGQPAATDRELTLPPEPALADYLAYAAANNPGLEAAFHRWQAAAYRIPQVRALPDPMVSYGYYLGEFTARRGMEQHIFELSQMFPWFGKLQLREDAASREAEMAAREYEAQRLELFLDVRRGYHELHLLGREIEITRENLELLMQIEAIARARLRAGTGMHADVVRAQVELGRMEDRLRELEQMQPPAIARLNAALNRRADAEIPWPAAPPAERLGADAEQLLAALAASNPRLHALESELERSRIETELARRERYPDVTISGMYALRGDDPVLATVGINIPLWREKYDAIEREAVSRRLAAAAMRHDELNRLSAELHEALFAHNDAQRRIELFTRTLLPKAEESLRASLTGFQAGTATFLDLLDAERTLLEFQLSQARARSDRAVALARLDALVGEPVPRILDDDEPVAPAQEISEPNGAQP